MKTECIASTVDPGVLKQVGGVSVCVALFFFFFYLVASIDDGNMQQFLMTLWWHLPGHHEENCFLHKVPSELLRLRVGVDI